MQNLKIAGVIWPDMQGAGHAAGRRPMNGAPGRNEEKAML